MNISATLSGVSLPTALMGVSTTVFFILERVRPDRELPQPTIQRVFSAIKLEFTRQSAVAHRISTNSDRRHGTEALDRDPAAVGLGVALVGCLVNCPLNVAF